MGKQILKNNNTKKMRKKILLLKKYRNNYKVIRMVIGICFLTVAILDWLKIIDLVLVVCIIGFLLDMIEIYASNV